MVFGFRALGCRCWGVWFLLFCLGCFLRVGLWRVLVSWFACGVVGVFFGGRLIIGGDVVFFCVDGFVWIFVAGCAVRLVECGGRVV